MRRHHAFYSHWCVLFQFYLDRRRIPLTAFADKVGLSQQAIHAHVTGKARPPLDKVESWGPALGMTKAELEQFVMAAYEAHTPERVWARILELETRKDPPQPIPPDECAKTIAALVKTLKEAEAVFVRRSTLTEGSGGNLVAERTKVSRAMREAIERYDQPPSRGGGR